MFKVDHKDQNIVTDWVDVSHRQLQVIWLKIIINYPVQTVTLNKLRQNFTTNMGFSRVLERLMEHTLPFNKHPRIQQIISMAKAEIV